MEKSRSYPEYSLAYSGFDFEDRANSYSFNGPAGKDDRFATSSDPELKRKKRVALYNGLTKEGKLKSSMKTGLKWIKSKFTDIRYA
ncbi:hypothetical protein QJS10_CPB13g00348 [Acorus calamus]|uniref:Uncharacterized protein n=1 Tax=Acorus calamus TaxID=4465 RepID=A0AAV9DGP3_ACOCL|nr:hypothetical protein QJS10_CPB13g00348 [Acorus calamus]